jgi:hypothetical protein
MTKEHYMALADIQDLWTNQQKPWIEQQFDEFAGPVYDEDDHGFVFPVGAAVEYDSTNHGFIFG